MTITMFDSISPSTLPAGNGFAYAGYIDGRWPDYAAISARFPHSHVLSITVNGNLNADCIDVERFDATIEQGAQWLIRKLSLGAQRPVVYASVSVMGPVIDAVQALHRENLSAIRLWTAHYGAGKHICGPSSCNQLHVSADGTQWTDTVDGVSLDESALLNNFFGTGSGGISSTGAVQPPSSVPTWETEMMNTLPVVQRGSKGVEVRRVQGLCLAELPDVRGITVDGDFGQETETAVKEIQASHHITADGIVGPVTWQVLVTGAS